MENILEKYDEMFAFLFDKYLEARAKGEEFYFRIWQNRDYADYLIVSFWNTNHAYPYINIWININIWVNIDTNECHIYISGIESIVMFMDRNDFETNSKQKYKDLDDIRRNFYEEIAGVLSVSPKPVVFASFRESFKEEWVLKTYKNISAFLEKDKGLIDTYLKEKEYNWFFNQNDFAQYVAEIRQSQADRNKKQFIAGLPFCLRSISVKNYKAIQHLEIEDIPSSTRWIFLTGENGIGKTLVLEAIALGLQAADWLESNAERDKCMIETQYQTQMEMAFAFHRADVLERYETPPNNIPITAYSCNRLSETENVSNMGISHLFEKANVINIDKWLNDLLNAIASNAQGIASDELRLIKDKATFELLLSSFQKILTTIFNIRLNDNNEQVLYEEADQNGEVISVVPFSALSAGYKNILRITADIIVRLSHTEMPSDNRNYVIQQPEDLAGIVIIDEFENHLHAKFQRKWVEILTDLFPKVQFIVSTHSPIPLLGAPKESVILHVERSKEEGITVERIYIENMENLQPNLLLTSPIFGLQDIFNIENKNVADIETEDDYAVMLQNEERRKRLKDIFLANQKS